MRWRKLARTLDSPFSSWTVDPEDFIRRSSATSPQATAGVFWLTRAGPFLEPPPGNPFMWGRTYIIWVGRSWGSATSSLQSLWGPLYMLAMFAFAVGFGVAAGV